MSSHDVFVTDADLSAHRPSPYKHNFLRNLLQNPLLVRIIVAIYLIVAMTSSIRIGDMTIDLRGFLVDLGLINDGTSNFVEGMLLALIASLPFAVLVVVNNLLFQMRTGVVFFRNIEFIRDITQIVILVIILGTGYGLVQNLDENLQQSGLIINWNALERNYKSAITEGPEFKETAWNWVDNWGKDLPLLGGTIQKYFAPGTNVRALMTGLYNTLRAVVVSLVLATIFGILLGIGLLSNNWLIRQVSGAYVEVFRNTPLLVQLFFVYRSFSLLVPGNPADAIQLPGSIYISGRGVNYPKIVFEDSFIYLAVFALVGFLIGAYLWRYRLKLQDQTGVPAFTLRYFSMAFFGLTILGFIVANIVGGAPVSFEEPVLGRFNFERNIGSVFTPEYLSLVVALVLYTAAFIADIVRAGIQSVPHGQIEAARAAGLGNGQTLRLIVLPQALRLIVPPLTNQYLNLSKNSSLAIAIGYYDFFNVSTIASNQEGQAVVFFAVILVTYLAISLIISAGMNLVNRSLRLRSR